MKIEILKENLKQGLNCVERITRKVLSLPILNNVLLSCEGNFLRLDVTNLEMSISWWVLAKIEEKGKITVPASFFANLLGFLKEKNITLESSDSKNLVLKTKDRKIQIQAMSPNDFPIIPDIKKEKVNKILAKDLQKAITQVVEIPALSQIKPEISGLYIFSEKNKLKIVGTDSFRLAEKTITLDKKPEGEISFILPQETSKELINILNQDPEGIVEMMLFQNQILFEISYREFSNPRVRILSRLIDGEFPRYQEIIPKSFKTQIILEKDEFQNHLKEAGLFSGRASEVKLKTFSKKNKLRIYSQSAEIGENESFISVKTKGEDTEVAFNYKFLLSGLQDIESSQVALELSGGDGPGVLRPIGDESYLYVLMPIKSS